MLKPSMIKILNILGFHNINDITTIISEKDFNKIDSNMIRELIIEHEIGQNILGQNIIDLDRFHDNNDTFYDLDTKLAVINRILQLKYEMIIDNIKEIDNNFYKLEFMPAGF